MLAQGRHYGLCALLLLTMPGCSSEPSSPVYNDPVPSVHLNPTWLSIDVVAFENTGAYDVGPGYAEIDLRNSGVIELNVKSGEFDMVVQFGKYPRSVLGSDIIAAYCGSVVGPVVVVDSTGEHVFEEPYSWERRTYFCANRTGSLFAWRSTRSDHEQGIWIYSIDAQEYTFLGRGNYLTWHPNEDVLLYESSEQSTKSSTRLVEYDFATGVLDTLMDFPSYLGCRKISYSPDGGRVAFFGFSTANEAQGLYILDKATGDFSKKSELFGWGLSWGPQGIVCNNDCGVLEDPGCGVLWLLDTETWQARQLTERFQFIFDGPDTSGVCWRE